MPDTPIDLESRMLAREIGDNPYAVRVGGSLLGAGDSIADRSIRRMQQQMADEAAEGASAAISEAAFQDKVIRLAKGAGWMVYHTYDSRRSEAGFPDLVLAHRDRGVIFAELKSASGKLTPAQQDWQRGLSDALPGPSDYWGSKMLEVLVWRPADWDSGCIAQWLLDVRVTVAESSPPVQCEGRGIEGSPCYGVAGHCEYHRAGGA